MGINGVGGNRPPSNVGNVDATTAVFTQAAEKLGVPHDRAVALAQEANGNMNAFIGLVGSNFGLKGERLAGFQTQMVSLVEPLLLALNGRHDQALERYA